MILLTGFINNTNLCVGNCTVMYTDNKKPRTAIRPIKPYEAFCCCRREYFWHAILKAT